MRQAVPHRFDRPLDHAASHRSPQLLRSANPPIGTSPPTDYLMSFSTKMPALLQDQSMPIRRRSSPRLRVPPTKTSLLSVSRQIVDLRYARVKHRGRSLVDVPGDGTLSARRGDDAAALPEPWRWYPPEPNEINSSRIESSSGLPDGADRRCEWKCARGLVGIASLGIRPIT